MPWSPEQLAVVENAVFAPGLAGYHPDDVERLRTRVTLAMRGGRPMPDLDAMALRRVPSNGVSVAQVDGLRTVLRVWARLTPIEDPEDLERREREEGRAALAAGDVEPRWTPEQMERVRRTTFSTVRRSTVSYAERDVDTYLDSVVAAMRRGVELPDPAYARFDSAGLRRGYDPKQVDDFLDEIARMRPEGR